jgi:hypothetical protein
MLKYHVNPIGIHYYTDQNKLSYTIYIARIVEANCNESEAESESIFHYSKTALLNNTQG